MSLDLLSELELMAGPVGTEANEGTAAVIGPATISKWQHLFQFTQDESERRIQEYRDDYYSRAHHISNKHWELVRDNYPEHDKEGYEFSLGFQTDISKPTKVTSSDPDAGFLLKLEGR
jgi:hypothetical protein